MTLGRGKFRVRGDTIEVHPAYEETVLRIEMFGDTVDRITVGRSAHRRAAQRAAPRSMVFPATHYVTGDERMRKAIVGIEAELQERLAVVRGRTASCSRRSGCGCARSTTSR